MSPDARLIAAFVIVFGGMVIEARRASRNERGQRSRGGVEPGDDVYGVMRFVYPASFLLMVGESVIRGRPQAQPFYAGAIVFAAAKALKWWAILTLGPSWTFRVIVVPGSARITHGPYRFFSHPNYLAVAGEFIGVALMTGAVVSGPATALVFAALVAKRISVEERALRASTQ